MFSLRHYTSVPTSLPSFLSRSTADSPPHDPSPSTSTPSMTPQSPTSPLPTTDTSTTDAPANPPPPAFNFERMTAKFEQIETEQKSNPTPLPTSANFVTAMREVTRLFDTLGTAFAFVRRDMDDKIAIIHQYANNRPRHFTNLHQAVQHELHLGTARSPRGVGTPSCSRTLLRLMWALKFANLLLDGLKQAFDDESDLLPAERTLKWAVARAYEEALAEHHSWTMRRAVKSACMLLPTKESFIVRLGVDTEDRDASLSRLAVSMAPLVKRMYAFYERNDILDLP